MYLTNLIMFFLVNQIWVNHSIRLKDELDEKTDFGKQVYMLVNYVVRYTSTSAGESRSKFYFKHRYCESIPKGFFELITSGLRDITRTFNKDINPAFVSLSKFSYDSYEDGLMNDVWADEVFQSSPFVIQFLTHVNAKRHGIQKQKVSWNSSIIGNWNPTSVEFTTKRECMVNLWKENKMMPKCPMYLKAYVVEEIRPYEEIMFPIWKILQKLQLIPNEWFLRKDNNHHWGPFQNLSPRYLRP